MNHDGPSMADSSSTFAALSKRSLSCNARVSAFVLRHRVLNAWVSQTSKGNILHNRNQHLRNHCGSSVALSNGWTVALLNIISLVSGIFQRVATSPVDLYWKFPLDRQWHFPMELNFGDLWRVIVCPDSTNVYVCICVYIYIYVHTYTVYIYIYIYTHLCEGDQPSRSRP